MCKVIPLAEGLMLVIFNLVRALTAITVCWVVMLSSVQCLARETYVQASARLAHQAAAENLVRADIEAELFRLTNVYRAAKGLRAFALDNVMQNEARAHALDMLQQAKVGHVASGGQDFMARMRALRGGGMVVMPLMGENAARVSKPGVVDAAMAAQLFQQWVKSAPHRKALLSRDFVKLAVGAVSKGGQLYADQIFTGPEVKTNLEQVGSESIY